MKAWQLAGASLLLLGGAASARDKDKPLPRAQVFQKVLDCRAISDSAQRLQCYDSEVARLDEAAAKQQVVVVDQAEVKKTRKGLFGFNLGDLNIFGGGDENDEGVNEITSKVESARQDGSGKWTIIIEGGARWVQIDTSRLRTPKPGQEIKIRRAAMGSYFANVNGQTAIRMKREN